MKLELLNEKCVADFNRWINNKEAVKYSLSSFGPPRTERWVREYVQDLNENENTWDQVIVHDGARIGFCGFCNISTQNRSAEFYILIGDSEHWGKGIGTEAGRGALEYGFNKLNLHRVWLTVSELNVAAIKSYQKLGFSHEGIMRDAAFRDGQYHDKVVMGILGKEMHNHSKLAESQEMLSEF